MLLKGIININKSTIYIPLELKVMPFKLDVTEHIPLKVYYVVVELSDLQWFGVG